jgi:hypothetical protein
MGYSQYFVCQVRLLCRSAPRRHTDHHSSVRRRPFHTGSAPDWCTTTTAAARPTAKRSGPTVTASLASAAGAGATRVPIMLPKPGSTDQPLLLSRESAVAADGLVGCRSTGVGA